MSETSDVTSERIVAVVRLAVALVCTVGSLVGVSIDPDSLFTVVMVVLALVTIVYSWYENNNLTEAATQAQHYLDAIKTRDSLVVTDSDMETIEKSDADETAAIGTDDGGSD